MIIRQTNFNANIQRLGLRLVLLYNWSWPVKLFKKWGVKSKQPPSAKKSKDHKK